VTGADEYRLWSIRGTKIVIETRCGKYGRTIMSINGKEISVEKGPRTKKRKGKNAEEGRNGDEVE
jgi:hypothetical protein